MPTAAELARARVERVRDDPEARLALMHGLYRGDDSTFLPYRRGAVAFTRWQVRRGLLRPPGGPEGGSPWWRAVNERLLRDGWEARALDDGHDPTGATGERAAVVPAAHGPDAAGAPRRAAPVTCQDPGSANPRRRPRRPTLRISRSLRGAP
ncbi:hypothetical protein [Actinomycetospora flava]|uniref:Uncharacterized protein n=1 Tax=Actinomycetospora flava TaxID=3129232 RepID=A0ABU8MCA1_9PSEU